jgi:hypothetical protein
VAGDVARAQGFFHWELDFAQVFAKGGYDLQVGNPPWVQPRWKENLVLAELDPWFGLAEKPTAAEWVYRKGAAIAGRNFAGNKYFLEEFASNVGVTATLGDLSTYPPISGSQPDLYRAFMCQAWAHSSDPGVSALLHPDSHFGGTKEGKLRALSYSHLRLHAQFMNKAKLFAEISDNALFGLHVYGRPQAISFTHASWLFSPKTLTQSLEHDGQGATPGLRHQGAWDTRPHRSRLITVNEDTLRKWQQLTGSKSVPLHQTQLLYPVTTLESEAIGALGKALESSPSQIKYISLGYHEASAKKLGYIRWANQHVEALDEVVLQGPHFGVALPFAKEPKTPCNSNNDWQQLDTRSIGRDLVPKTNYVRACQLSRYQDEQDQWNGRRYTEYYRLAWRKMIAFNGERSLFAALIPPGPAHIDSVQSMGMEDVAQTVLHAGFWSSLPLDYLLRIMGKANLHRSDVATIPSPQANHPLSIPLTLRTLRLNSLTEAYGSLWEQLFDPASYGREEWAYDAWPNIAPLTARLTQTWTASTPLRTEYERRAALVELDSLVSVWLGITANQLIAIYKSRFPVLAEREAEMFFDSRGRRVARDSFAYGQGQNKDTYQTLLAHLDLPDTTPPPEGYEPPFYKADREAEMRGAHAHFQARLDAEIAAGRWTPPEPAEGGREVPVDG